MKTNKCKWCEKRFRVQDWKEGEEREICFACKTTKNWINSLTDQERVAIFKDYLHISGIGEKIFNKK
jgi:hypothetical protein